MNSFWDTENEQVSSIFVDGIEIAIGSRVRLRPKPGADIMDMALAGKVAIVQALERDFDDVIQIAVTVEDDPGRDLGELRQPGHRFFFRRDEVEPLDATP